MPSRSSENNDPLSTFCSSSAVRSRRLMAHEGEPHVGPGREQAFPRQQGYWHRNLGDWSQVCRAKSNPSSAMGRARAAACFASALEAIPSSTRLAIPCRIEARRNMLNAR